MKDKITQDLKEEWKRYVESYNIGSMKHIHLVSATHVVNNLIKKAVELKEKAIADEIDNWCKHKYPFEWFKKAGAELKQKLIGK